MKKVKKEVKQTHKQAIYIAPKSTHKSQLITAPEPIWGCPLMSERWVCTAHLILVRKKGQTDEWTDTRPLH